MIKSKMFAASGVAFASLVLVLGLLGWMRSVSPIRVAQAAGLIDDSFADFSSGTGCYVRASGSGGLGGEVIVTPTLAVDTGGTVYSVDETTIAVPGTWAPAQSLEFTATFVAASGQLAGFGVSNYSAAPFAIFNSNGTDLLVRTDAGAGETPNNLGSGYLGAPHRYRIDWGTTGVVYSVDGTALFTHSVSIATNMSILFQDFNLGGTALEVTGVHLWSWMCTFQSRMINSTYVGFTFTGISTTLSTPAGTGIAFEARTSVNGVDWGAWTPVNADGIFSVGVGQYLQYSATLSTSDALITPEAQIVQAHGLTPTAVRVTSFSAANPNSSVQALLIGVSSLVLVLGSGRAIMRRRKPIA